MQICLQSLKSLNRSSSSDRVKLWSSPVLPTASRPACTRHQGRTSPQLHPQRRTQTPVAPLAGRATPSPSNTFSECAKKGCGPCVWAPVAAEQHRLVGNVLPFERAEVIAIVFHLASEHGIQAVGAGVMRIGRCNASVQGELPSAECSR